MFGRGKLSREEEAAIRARVRVEMDERRRRGFVGRFARDYYIVAAVFMGLVVLAKLTGHIPAAGQ